MVLAAGSIIMLGTGLSSHLQPARVFPHLAARSAGIHRRVAPVRPMAAQLGYEAWVKGDPKKQVLGDCELCVSRCCS